MTKTTDSKLDNTFVWDTQKCPMIETPYRRILTDLPAPIDLEQLRDAARYFPRVNCYQPPIVWDHAKGFQVFDAAGNCWIDFSSTAVMTNTGHSHESIRKALQDHLDGGLLAQFSFASQIRNELAKRLLRIAPSGCDKIYFWTVGSEAIECALRLARVWGMQKDTQKYHVLTHSGDYHGWTLGAHQLSGTEACKPWLPCPDAAIHHIPFPRLSAAEPDTDWTAFLDHSLGQLADAGVQPNQVAAVFVETLQGWGALPLPVLYVQRLRRWCDDHEVLLIFDEIQTGFGRTGSWFGHEHYGVKADLLCVGKGLTSSLPLAAVLGPAEVLDSIEPGQIATTHAAHPLSCAAALANLQVMEDESLVEAAASKESVARNELTKLQRRFPDQIAEISGLGLMLAIHFRDPATGQPDRQLAQDMTWAAVKNGVMLFFTNGPTIKICPPLMIPEQALVEGIGALGDALASLV